MTASLIIVITLAAQVCKAGNETTPEGRRDGWVSQPDGRGTFDILWCLTVALQRTHCLL